MDTSVDLKAILRGYQEQLADLKRTSDDFRKAGLLSKYKEAQKMAEQVEHMVQRLQNMGYGEPTAPAAGPKDRQAAAQTIRPGGTTDQEPFGPKTVAPHPASVQSLDSPHMDLNADGNTWEARINMPDVTSGSQVEVDVLSHGIIELLASGTRTSIPIPGMADSASLAVKFSKKLHILTLTMPSMSFQELSERCARDLSCSAFCMVDNFLSQSVADDMLRWASEQMRTGGLSAGEVEGGLQPEKRGDCMAWMSPSEAASLGTYAEQLDRLILEIIGVSEELAQKGLLRDKAMVTCYPGSGARYVRHMDNTNKGTKTRVITCILYLNPEWVAGDGGELRLHLQCGVTDIEPRHNRLAIFWSDHRVPHEVLPAFQERYAVSFWYHDEHKMDTAS